ncbi:MAG: hypothetical protein M9928_00370 [Anaerolineae bacterium]|nr:hypothetical protein [Anaerolineae bacterium]
MIIGVLGLFGVPQSLGFSAEQLILGLLTFLALEALIVNIGYLDKQNDDLEQIKSKVVSPGLDALVAPRAGRFEFADHVDGAKDVLVCGISLEGFVMHQSNLLSQMIAKGCRVRLITLDPDVTFLDSIDLGTATHVGAAVIQSNIESGIRRIELLHQSLPENRRHLLELRHYSGLPFLSAVLIRTNDAGAIWVSYYAYGGAIGDRRGILIDSKTSAANYPFYVQTLENLWTASQTRSVEKEQS